MKKRKRRRTKDALPTWYKVVIVIICVAGTVGLAGRIREVWLVHADMQQTITQEATLTAEQEMLQKRKDTLQTPQEIESQAREQFGLVKAGEIPYKR